MNFPGLKSIFRLGNSAQIICRGVHATGTVLINKPPRTRKPGMGKEDGHVISDSGAAKENAYFKRLENDMLQRLRGGRKPDKSRSSSKKSDSKY